MLLLSRQACGKLKLCLRLLVLNCLYACIIYSCAYACSCAYMCIKEASGRDQITSSIIFPIYFLRHSLPLNHELSRWLRQVGSKPEGSLHSRPPQHWDYRHEPPGLDFTRMLVIKDRTQCLCDKHFTE